jgi:hypothetical protein
MYGFGNRARARQSFVVLGFAFAIQTAVSAALAAPPSASSVGSPLSLFGTPLKGATRAVLRQTLQQAGLTPTRIDDNYYCDLYKTNGVPANSTELQVCYTEDNDAFASAQYTYPSFMDVNLVQRVVDTVSTKYGKPSSLVGNYGLGSVTARWIQPQGMEVRVTRGWPDTTTYLHLIDVANENKRQAQAKAAEEARQRRRALEDARAF